MPRSFLVKLKPSMDNLIDKQNRTNSQPSSDISYNLPPEIFHPDIARSLRSHSQSSSSIGVKSHLGNESAFHAVTPQHHVGSAFEIVIPTPQYRMPYYMGWEQHGWLPSNNHAWYSPVNTSPVNDLQLRWPWEAHGEPVHSEDKSLERKSQKVSEAPKFSSSFNELLAFDEPSRTHHRESCNAETIPAAAHKFQPELHASFDKHTQAPTQATASKIRKQKQGQNENSPEKNESSSLSEKSAGSSSSSGTVDDKTRSSSKCPEKLHTCQQCKKTFNRASNLRAHMKTHSDYRPYKCDFCGKGFHQKIDKRIHHYTHTGEKPHKCKKCGRGFKQLTHLNYHMRTHSDTHMYHCTYCGKGFNQKGNLQSHIYGHTGQRPFKCQICSKGFTLRSTLNTHLRTHAPKKPFVCEHCNKAFYQKNALKMHHIASHPIVNGKSIL